MRRPCYPIVTPYGRILSSERLESSARAFNLSNESARRGPGFSYLNLLDLDSSYVDFFHDLANFSATHNKNGGQQKCTSTPTSFSPICRGARKDAGTRFYWAS